MFKTINERQSSILGLPAGTMSPGPGHEVLHSNTVSEREFSKLHFSQHPTDATNRSDYVSPMKMRRTSFVTRVGDYAMHMKQTKSSVRRQTQRIQPKHQEVNSLED
jgi:hypothetical protein